MSVAALVISALLIIGAGGIVARADWALAPRGREGIFERLWVILPAGFLVLLLVFAARAVLT